jgi:hypothetical protein
MMAMIGNGVQKPHQEVTFLGGLWHDRRALEKVLSVA